MSKKENERYYDEGSKAARGLGNIGKDLGKIGRSLGEIGKDFGKLGRDIGEIGKKLGGTENEKGPK